MTPRNSLRRRFIAATFALVAVICTLFTATLFGTLEYAEWILFDKHIESDIRSFVSQYRQDPGVANLPHESFEVYVTPVGHEEGLPDYLHGRAGEMDDDDADDTDDDRGEADDEDEPGDVDDEEDNDEEDNDEVIHDGHEYHLDVRTVDGTTFYFLFDETEFEAFDQLLNVFIPALIVAICAIAAGLGWLQAARITRPLQELAARVNRMEAAPGPAAAAGGGADEITILAQAVDSYAARVAELVAREREFSTDVSHELRTPLMGIQAAAENLQRPALTPERVEELSRRIEARCGQMRALVEAMLALARDPRSLENDFCALPLAGAVRQQLDMLAPHIEAKGLTVKVEEQAPLQVHTSPAILDVVLGNILRNAIFHSESSTIEVHIGTRSLAVRDFGRGIPEDMRARLFERHVSGAGNGGDNMGVGLALVKRICAHFQWPLTLESVPGQGTRIDVDFGESARA